MAVDATGRFLFASNNGRMSVISTGRASSTINRGDVDFDRQLDPGETWFFGANSVVAPGSADYLVRSSASNVLWGIVDSTSEFHLMGSDSSSLNANIAGATVYQGPGLASDWILSDERFVIEADTIRLKNGQFVASGEDGLEILVRESENATDVRRSIVVNINDVPAWQNQAVPEDVNNDQAITALDALIIINQLNENQAGMLGPRPVDLERFVDVTGDGRLTSLDALRVINSLNDSAQVPQAEPDWGSPASEPLSARFDQSLSGDADRKKRLDWLDEWFATF
jgi:hypothetical protein